MKKLVIGSAFAALAAGVVGTGVYLGSSHPASADTELAAASEQVAGQVVGGDPVDAAPSGQQPNRNPHQPLRLHRIRRLARRIGVHGEASVRTRNGFVQIAWQRGVVTGRNGDNLTVRSLDGTVWQWTASGTTRVRKDGKKAAVANLATNDFVVIAGREPSEDQHTAGAVVVPRKVPAKATQTPTPAPTSS